MLLSAPRIHTLRYIVSTRALILLFVRTLNSRLQKKSVSLFDIFVFVLSFALSLSCCGKNLRKWHNYFLHNISLMKWVSRSCNGELMIWLPEQNIILLCGFLYRSRSYAWCMRMHADNGFNITPLIYSFPWTFLNSLGQRFFHIFFILINIFKV